MLWSRTRPHFVRFVLLNLGYILVLVLIGLLLRNFLISGSERDVPVTLRFFKSLVRGAILVIPNAILIKVYSCALLKDETGWSTLRPSGHGILNLFSFQIGAQLLFTLPFVLVMATIDNMLLRAGILFPMTLATLYLLVRTIFAPLSIVYGELSVKEAVNESFRITGGRFWQIVLRFILLGAVAFSGILLLGVGYLATMALATSGYILLFAKLVQK